MGIVVRPNHIVQLFRPLVQSDDSADSAFINILLRNAIHAGNPRMEDARDKIWQYVQQRRNLSSHMIARALTDQILTQTLVALSRDQDVIEVMDMYVEAEVIREEDVKARAVETDERIFTAIARIERSVAELSSPGTLGGAHGNYDTASGWAEDVVFGGKVLLISAIVVAFVAVTIDLVLSGVNRKLGHWEEWTVLLSGSVISVVYAILSRQRRAAFYFPLLGVLVGAMIAIMR